LFSAQLTSTFSSAVPSSLHADVKHHIATIAQAAFVDLVVQSVNAPLRPLIINERHITSAPASVRVVNRGDVVAKGTVSVRFYLSKDGVLDGTDVLAGGVPSRRIALRPGQAQLFNGRLRPPTDLAGGRYYLFAIVTSGGGIVQSNPADEIGLAHRPVKIVRNRPPLMPGEQGYYQDVCYGGDVIDYSAGEPEVITTPDTQPSDSIDVPPTSEPTTQPDFPQTQPTTDPSPPPPPSDPGFSDSPPSDSGGSDSSGSSDGGGDPAD
jgi:hypothetical protein